MYKIFKLKKVKVSLKETGTEAEPVRQGEYKRTGQCERTDVFLSIKACKPDLAVTQN